MKRYGVAAGFLLALACVSSGSAARDAFPGLNGRIAFLRGNQELFVMNADGSHQNRLLRNASNAPAWSPDGRRLIAVGGFGTPPARVDPEFVSSPVGSPSWSPDGHHLVGVTGEGLSVEVVDLDSGVQRRIYLDEGIGYPTLSNPAWSPDGRLIAFNTEAGAILFYDVAHHRLLLGHGWGFGIDGQDPAWSPDGRQLAVGTFTGPFYQPGPTPKSSSVFTAPSDGTQFWRRIARNASQPAWSPDGRKIVFVRLLARGNSELFVMNADGTHQRRLTFNPGTDSAPDWQPLPPGRARPLSPRAGRLQGTT
jgi:TolB protein